MSDLNTLDGWLRASEAERFAHLFGRDIRTGRRVGPPAPGRLDDVQPSIDAILATVVITIATVAIAVFVVIPVMLW